MPGVDEVASSPARTAAATPASCALGLRIAHIAVTVEGLSDELRQGLADLLRPFVVDVPDATAAVRLEVRRPPRHSGWVIAQNGEVRRSVQDVEKLLTYLEWCAAATALEATAAHAVFHMAALTRGGATVLLVADSGAGKTTLTTSLIQRGWQPFGDDITLVNPATQAVQTFPRCFHVDAFTESSIVMPALFERSRSLAGYIRPLSWAESGSRPTCIMQLTRDAQAAATAYPLTQAEAAGALLAASLGRGISKPEVVRIAVGLAATARGCWQVNNSGLSETTTVLEQLASAGGG